MGRGDSILTVAFYRPSETDPPFNRFVAGVSGGICHVEVALAADRGKVAPDDVTGHTQKMDAYCV